MAYSREARDGVDPFRASVLCGIPDKYTGALIQAMDSLAKTSRPPNLSGKTLLHCVGLPTAEHLLEYGQTPREKQIGKETRDKSMAAMNAQLVKAGVATIEVPIPYETGKSKLIMTVTPEAAVCKIEDGKDVNDQPTATEQLVRDLPQLKAATTNCFGEVCAQVSTWIASNPNWKRYSDSKTENMYKMGEIAFKQELTEMSFPPETVQEIGEWFRKTTDPTMRAVAKALLSLTAGNNTDRSFLKSALASSNLTDDVIQTLGVTSLGQSIFSLMANEERIKAYSEWQKGQVRTNIEALLLGSQLKYTATGGNTVTALPKELLSKLKPEQKSDGSIFFDLRTEGSDLIAVMAGLAKEAVDMSAKVAGDARMFEYSGIKISLGNPRQQKGDGSEARLSKLEELTDGLSSKESFMQWARIFRRGEDIVVEGDDKREETYPPSVASQLAKIRKLRGGTIIGPTGSGKTTFAGIEARKMIKESSRYGLTTQSLLARDSSPGTFSVDDVVVLIAIPKTGQDILTALDHTANIYDQRNQKGQATIVLTDDMQTCDFREIDQSVIGDTLRGSRNAITRQVESSSQVKNGPRYLTLLMGERLPPGISASLVQDHVFPLVDTTGSGIERFMMGQELVQNHLVDMAENIASRLRVELDNEEHAAESLGQTEKAQELARLKHIRLDLEKREKISDRLWNEVFNYFHSNEGNELSDRFANNEDFRFFTLSRWDKGVGETLAERLRADVEEYITTGRSAILHPRFERDGIVFTKEGRANFKTVLKTILEKAEDDTLFTAEEKRKEIQTIEANSPNAMRKLLENVVSGSISAVDLTNNTELRHQLAGSGAKLRELIENAHPSNMTPVQYRETIEALVSISRLPDAVWADEGATTMAEMIIRHLNLLRGMLDITVATEFIKK